MDTTRTDVSTPYRVLLVLGEEADDRLISSTLETVKSILNFRISRAPSVPAAIALNAAEAQDVAILDVQPGLDALDAFRREARGLPVIAFARSAELCTPSQAAQHGAQDLLVRGGSDPFLLVRAVRYAAERRRSREALRRHLDKLARFQGALLDLAKRDTSDPGESLRRLCEGAASTLEVERVGIWLFNADHTEIRCACLYSKSRGAFEKEGTVIRSRDFPRYFAALEESRVVAAS